MNIGADLITILLQDQCGTSLDVEIRSTRNAKAARVLEGKSVGEACSLLPLIFSLCGRAQHQGGLNVCEAALGIIPSPAVQEARKLILYTETISEHLTRILIDWPGNAGLGARADIIRDLRKRLSSVSSLLFEPGEADKVGGSPLNIEREILREILQTVRLCTETHVLGKSLDCFMSLSSSDDFLRWCQTNTCLSARCFNSWIEEGLMGPGMRETKTLPEIAPAVMSTFLEKPDVGHFLSVPTFNGDCYETGPLERQIAHPLIQALQKDSQPATVMRLAAKLLDLGTHLQKSLQIAEHFNEEQETATTDATGRATRCVQAVRGQLWHDVTLDVETRQIKHYRILAPTEWNFHPSGVLFENLSSLTNSSVNHLKKQARLQVMALDPCVGCDIIFSSAQG